MNTGVHSGEAGRAARELFSPGRYKKVLRTHAAPLLPPKPSLPLDYLLPSQPFTGSSLKRPSLMIPDYRGHIPTLSEQCLQRPHPQETHPGPHLCISTALGSWCKRQTSVILPQTQEQAWFDSPLCTYPLDTAHSRCSIDAYLKYGTCPFLPRVWHPSPSVPLPPTSPVDAPLLLTL